MGLADWLQQLFDSAIRFAYQNSGPIAVLGLFIVALIIIRRWPDRVVFIFLRYGLRVTPEMQKHLRTELAEMAAKRGKQALHEIITEQGAIESLRGEIRLLKKQAGKGPLLVRDVGRALVAVEKEYLKKLKIVKSDQAKEVLRLAAEKGILEILHSANTGTKDTPAFHIADGTGETQQK